MCPGCTRSPRSTSRKISVPSRGARIRAYDRRAWADRRFASRPRHLVLGELVFRAAGLIDRDHQPRRADSRPCDVEIAPIGVELGGGGEVPGLELAGPVEGLLGVEEISLRLAERLLGGRQGAFLDLAEAGLGGGERAFGLVHCCAEILVVQQDQQVAFLDGLALLDRERWRPPRSAGCQCRRDAAIRHARPRPRSGRCLDGPPFRPRPSDRAAAWGRTSPAGRSRPRRPGRAIAISIGSRARPGPSLPT